MNANDNSPTLFTNVKVWDGHAEGITANTSVLVEGNLIKRVQLLLSPDGASSVF